jgi:hypothetical protein
VEVCFACLECFYGVISETETAATKYFPANTTALAQLLAPGDGLQAALRLLASRP